MNVPLKPGTVLVFLISYSPRYQKPPRSLALAIFTCDLTFSSGEPGPTAPAAMVVSHFQLPSSPLYRVSSSGDGVGIAGGAAAVGAAPGAAAGVAGFATAGAAGGALAGAVVGAAGFSAGFGACAKANVPPERNTKVRTELPLRVMIVLLLVCFRGPG